MAESVGWEGEKTKVLSLFIRMLHYVTFRAILLDNSRSKPIDGIFYCSAKPVCIGRLHYESAQSSHTSPRKLLSASGGLYGYAGSYSLVLVFIDFRSKKRSA
jgi:hypothetical protein